MSEETAGYQVENNPLLNGRMRARTYYAASVSLFQSPSAEDCKRAIALLNKAIGLYPKFSEASLFRCDVWHYRFKSFGWGITTERMRNISNPPHGR